MERERVHGAELEKPHISVRWGSYNKDHLVVLVWMNADNTQFDFYLNTKGVPYTPTLKRYKQLGWNLRDEIDAAVHKSFGYISTKDRKRLNVVESTLDGNGNVIRAGDYVTYWINGKREAGVQEMDGNANWRVKRVTEDYVPVGKNGARANDTHEMRVVVHIEHEGYPTVRRVSPGKIVKQEGRAVKA